MDGTEAIRVIQARQKHNAWEKIIKDGDGEEHGNLRQCSNNQKEALKFHRPTRTPATYRLPSTYSPDSHLMFLLKKKKKSAAILKSQK